MEKVPLVFRRRESAAGVSGCGYRAKYLPEPHPEYKILSAAALMNLAGVLI